MEFWLVTTDHLSTRIWFRDDEDYRMGMNLVAILACVLGVQVLAFELMSNHVHFVLHGTHEQAKHFCDEYKKRYSQYLNKKYGTKDFLRKVAVDILLVDGMDESLERAIAYVQMNCVAARICLSPTGYPWGTGNVFFKATPVKGRRIGTFSKRSLRLLLHSTEELPPHLLVGDEGYILPECYVQVQWVESIFRTPQRMDFFLRSSSKAKKRLDEKDWAPSFKDQLVLAAIPDLCQSLFRKTSMVSLNEEELVELVKQLRYRFSSGIHQLMRVTGLSYERVVGLLDRV